MEPKKTRTPKPLPRKIHTDGGVWSYQIGDSGVNIRNPDCSKTQFVKFTEMLSLTIQQVEQLKRKHELMVTPAEVHDYIVEKLA